MTVDEIHKKRTSLVRELPRFRTTYANARKETLKAERSNVCICMSTKVLISVIHKAQLQQEKPLAMSKKSIKDSAVSGISWLVDGVC